MNDEVRIRCSYDELVDIRELKANPRNPNKHSREQIDRLAKVIKYQGVRRPATVSKQSGFVNVGHGMVEALRILKVNLVPVSYQDFDSDEQEYAHMVADNSLASWADLDLSAINLEIPDLGPDFDLETLGLKNFTIDRIDKPDKPPFKCPECGWLKPC